MTAQPIPVKDAVEAVQAALDVCAKPADMFAHCGHCGISFLVDVDFDASEECNNRDSIGSPCGGTFTLTHVPAMEFTEHGEAFVSAARAVLPGALEFVLGELKARLIYHERYPELQLDVVEKGEPIYVAVAPIVAWWRQSGAQGGGK